MRSFIVVVALLSGCASVTVKESTFIRPDSVTGAKMGTRFDQAALQALRPAAVLVEQEVALADGAAAHGVLIRQPEARATVLYFGGNAFHLDRHAPQVLEALATCNVNVAMFDYRGYGRSSGSPTVALMAADALTIFDHVNAQFPGRVVVHGQSLGSFIGASVAQQRPAQALVLESTATSPMDWAKANIPWYARPFVTINVTPQLAAVDNVAAVSAFRGPGLVLVGENDRITPAALGKRVYDVMPGSQKEMVIARGAGHNDVLASQATRQDYCAFIDKIANTVVPAQAGTQLQQALRSERR
jgi:pimeloyl-ACP methyl ester carboxylesterase